LNLLPASADQHVHDLETNKKNPPMTRKLPILAAFAALAILSVGSMASADMSSGQRGTNGSATTGYPLNIDTVAEFEATRTVKKGVYCVFMRRSQACPNPPEGEHADIEEHGDRSSRRAE
jgi:hypothetical protein